MRKLNNNNNNNNSNNDGIYIALIHRCSKRLNNKGCFGHWEAIIGGHSSKSLHYSICPNARSRTKS